jgi:hypothetical protein
LNSWFSDFPLSRAEHRRGGRGKRADLSERSESPRAPTDSATRRIKRDTGVFFWFVFFYAEENEHTKKYLTPDRQNLSGSSTRGEGFIKINPLT